MSIINFFVSYPWPRMTLAKEIDFCFKSVCHAVIEVSLWPRKSSSSPSVAATVTGNRYRSSNIAIG